MKLFWTAEIAIVYNEKMEGLSGRQVGGSPDPSEKAKGPVFDAAGTAARLPMQPTPFIGRIEELEELRKMMREPGCRLLTLLGPGGIGKTRLALALARREASNYAHGVCFVPLQPVESTAFLVPTIADALSLPHTGPAQLQTQVQNYLRGKEVLLLLDNFEQLLPDNGQATVATLLQTIAGVTFLVTSRAALDLQVEWVYRVRGMSFPQAGQQGAQSEREAVDLFVERARRVRPDFSRTDEQQEVTEICRLVDGIPLALELAAAWTKILSCREIVAEMARNLDILTTSRRDVDDRHRSIQAIFDQTWTQLTGRQQAVFEALSVFRGGFQREAAEEIAGASLPVLSALQDKALVHWGGRKRYEIHELLRQYAFAQLARRPDRLVAVRDAHCAYFARYLGERERDLMGSRQVEVTGEIQTELENVRFAWQWAVRQGKVAEIKEASFALGNFYQYQSRYHESLDAFEPASERLEGMTETESVSLALIDTLMVRAWFYLRFGRVEEIRSVMAQSEVLHRKLGIEPQPGYVTDPAILLSFAELVRGDYGEALVHAQRALETARRQPHQPGNREFAHYLLAQVALASGEYDEARRQARAAHAIALSMQDDWFRAYILNAMAELACLEERFDLAEQHYESSYAIREAFNDIEGMALALGHLSEIALRQGRFGDARRSLHRSLAVYEDIDDTGGVATCHIGLGDTAQEEGEFRTALAHYREALARVIEISFVPATLSLLVSLGRLFVATNRAERGLSLFFLVANHPSAKEETKREALALIDSTRLRVRAAAVIRCEADAQEGALAATVKALHAELPLLDLTAVEAVEEPEDPNEGLVEPLTGREFEVLQLLAEGLTNRQIASQLVIAEGTVKYYTRQIYGKLQVRNRIRAVTVARDLGLV